MFHDATEEIRDALRDPDMAKKVAEVRAEMDLEDARALAVQAIDDLVETFRTQGPWATFAARQKCWAAQCRLQELSIYRPGLFALLTPQVPGELPVTHSSHPS